MRVFAIILLMGCLSMGAWCQDVLVTRDGVRHDGFVTEENKDHVTLRMRSEDGSVRDTTIVRSEIYDLQFGVTEEGRSAEEMDNRTAVSAGLWVAGSSVAGVELERMLGSRWSVMAGAGVAGASAGVGCHFQRTVNSGMVAARCSDLVKSTTSFLRTSPPSTRKNGVKNFSTPSNAAAKLLR